MGDEVGVGEPDEGLVLPSVPAGAAVTVEAVATGGEFEIFCGEFFCLEGLVKPEAIFRGNDAIVEGVSEKGGGSFVGDLFLVGEKIDEFWRGVGAEQVDFGALVAFVAEGDDGIDEDEKIGAGAELGDGIGGIEVTGVEVSASGGGEVTAGGESADADAVGEERPVFGVGADDTDGALGVEEGDERVTAREAIFEDDAGDIVGV